MSVIASSGTQEQKGGIQFFLIGLAGGIGFIVLLSLVFFALLQAGDNSVEPYVDEYLAKFNAGDFAAIYAGAQGTLKDDSSEEEFVAAQSEWRELLGSATGKTIRGISMTSERRATTYEASYNAEFEKGPGVIRLTFARSEGAMKLANVEIRSPLKPEPRRFF